MLLSRGRGPLTCWRPGPRVRLEYCYRVSYESRLCVCVCVRVCVCVCGSGSASILPPLCPHAIAAVASRLQPPSTRRASDAQRTNPTCLSFLALCRTVRRTTIAHNSRLAQTLSHPSSSTHCTPLHLADCAHPHSAAQMFHQPSCGHSSSVHHSQHQPTGSQSDTPCCNVSVRPS